MYKVDLYFIVKGYSLHVNAQFVLHSYIFMV